MKNWPTILLLLFLVSSCNTVRQKEPLPITTNNPGKVLQTIAFGSCNKEDAPQDMWNPIVLNQPDLWIWLGDNIYGDTEDMRVMKKKYDRQNSHSEYQALLATCPIIGTWDDHDYGKNDAGKEYVAKKESKELMLDFLGVPKSAAVRQREGVYQSYTFGSGDRKVKILLLDVRSFRDPLEPTNDPNGPRYHVNPDGDILGTEQWKWLEKELRANEAAIHIICSGIQILPDEQLFEKWANFPRSKGGLLKLLTLTQPNRPILLSGDRHIAEITTINTNNGLLPEITSSGLTHSYEKADEPNRHREGDLVAKRNFGVLHIDWEKKPVQLSVEIRGLNNVLFQKFNF